MWVGISTYFQGPWLMIPLSVSSNTFISCVSFILQTFCQMNHNSEKTIFSLKLYIIVAMMTLEPGDHSVSEEPNEWLLHLQGLVVSHMGQSMYIYAGRSQQSLRTTLQGRSSRRNSKMIIQNDDSKQSVKTILQKDPSRWSGKQWYKRILQDWFSGDTTG